MHSLILWLKDKVFFRLELTGIILSGGKSRRMGKEKGTSLLFGKPLIEYAVDVITQICDEIIIGTNTNDYNYLGYQVVRDEIKNIGPIGGIYSCLKSSQTTDNIILSCDMPLVSVDLTKYILSEREDFEVVVPEFKGFPEPLCAFYNKNIIDRLLKNIHSGKFKIQEVIKQFHITRLPIDSTLPFYNEHLFTNINSPDDLKKIEKLIIQ